MHQPVIFSLDELTNGQGAHPYFAPVDHVPLFEYRRLPYANPKDDNRVYEAFKAEAFAYFDQRLAALFQVDPDRGFEILSELTGRTRDWLVTQMTNKDRELEVSDDLVRQAFANAHALASADYDNRQSGRTVSLRNFARNILLRTFISRHNSVAFVGQSANPTRKPRIYIHHTHPSDMNPTLVEGRNISLRAHLVRLANGLGIPEKHHEIRQPALSRWTSLLSPKFRAHTQTVAETRGVGFWDAYRYKTSNNGNNEVDVALTLRRARESGADHCLFVSSGSFTDEGFKETWAYYEKMRDGGKLTPYEAYCLRGGRFELFDKIEWLAKAQAAAAKQELRKEEIAYFACKALRLYVAQHQLEMESYQHAVEQHKKFGTVKPSILLYVVDTRGKEPRILIFNPNRMRGNVLAPGYEALPGIKLTDIVDNPAWFERYAVTDPKLCDPDEYVRNNIGQILAQQDRIPPEPAVESSGPSFVLIKPADTDPQSLRAADLGDTTVIAGTNGTIISSDGFNSNKVDIIRAYRLAEEKGKDCFIISYGEFDCYATKQAQLAAQVPWQERDDVTDNSLVHRLLPDISRIVRTIDYMEFLGAATHLNDAEKLALANRAAVLESAYRAHNIVAEHARSRSTPSNKPLLPVIPIVRDNLNGRWLVYWQNRRDDEGNPAPGFVSERRYPDGTVVPFTKENILAFMREPDFVQQYCLGGGVLSKKQIRSAIKNYVRGNLRQVQDRVEAQAGQTKIAGTGITGPHPLTLGKFLFGEAGFIQNMGECCNSAIAYVALSTVLGWVALPVMAVATVYGRVNSAKRQNPHWNFEISGILSPWKERTAEEKANDPKWKQGFYAMTHAINGVARWGMKNGVYKPTAYLRIHPATKRFFTEHGGLRLYAGFSGLSIGVGTLSVLAGVAAPVPLVFVMGSAAFSSVLANLVTAHQRENLPPLDPKAPLNRSDVFSMVARGAYYAGYGALTLTVVGVAPWTVALALFGPAMEVVTSPSWAKVWKQTFESTPTLQALKAAADRNPVVQSVQNFLSRPIPEPKGVVGRALEPFFHKESIASMGNVMTTAVVAIQSLAEVLTNPVGAVTFALLSFGNMSGCIGNYIFAREDMNEAKAAKAEKAKTSTPQPTDGDGANGGAASPDFALTPVPQPVLQPLPVAARDAVPVLASGHITSAPFRPALNGVAAGTLAAS